MRHALLMMTALLALAACKPGPTMDDERYKPGIYNVTQAEFKTSNPNLATQEGFLNAQRIVPDMITELLPEVPEAPNVTMVIDVTRAGRNERTYATTTVDKNGKVQDSADLHVSVYYELDTMVTLFDNSTGKQIAHAYVGHSVQLSNYTQSSSFTETLLSGLFSGGESKVDFPAFYRDYARQLVLKLYPQLKKK